MPEEIKEPTKEESEKKELLELIEIYEHFSNPVKVAMAENNGLRIIIEKLSKIEEKLDKLGNKQ